MPKIHFIICGDLIEVDSDPEEPLSAAAVRALEKCTHPKKGSETLDCRDVRSVDGWLMETCRTITDLNLEHEFASLRMFQDECQTRASPKSDALEASEDDPV